MPAVAPGIFKSERTPGDVDWKNWMQMAEERYQAYAQTQQHEAVERSGELGSGLAGACADLDGFVAPNVDADGEGDAESLRDFIESDPS